MGNEVTYSVIVPVWNGEKTLRRCLDSLLLQNRRDTEILVIDDGSTDESLSIAKEYAAKYPAVFCISQENGGVSRARNRGLAMARGKYITFLDCDDYVTEDYFAALDGAGDCDLLVFGRKTVGGKEPGEGALFAALAEERDVSRRLALLLASRKIMPPWNKRFRRELVVSCGLRFLEGMDTAEDFCFCFSYALRCGSIVCIPQELCCIDISCDASLSRKYRPRLEDTMCRAFCYAAKADGAEKYGAILDWLFVKAMFGCIAEEWKRKRLRYGKDRSRIQEICSRFRTSLSDGHCGLSHRAVRWLLMRSWYYPIYLAAYLGKGRKFAIRRKHG